MDEINSGYILDVKRPTREGFVACLVITPKTRDGGANIGAKIERNLGRDKAIQIARELLAACGASDNLLQQLHSLSPQ